MPRHLALDAALRCIEASLDRELRDGRLIDLRSALRSLPLAVQCAVRVHDRREPSAALILGLDDVGEHGLVERRLVLIARAQGNVLLFSRTGALDAAGVVRLPDAPISPGERWLRIDWHGHLSQRDWY